MAYLESKQFIHRDLASRNCLVGERGEVKVADFGMSRFMNSAEYHGSVRSAVPVRSIPPEVIKSRRFSSKSDVWAFGLLMWEVFTCGDAPFGNLDHKQVLDRVEEGYILDKPPAAFDADYRVKNTFFLLFVEIIVYFQVMRSCWAYKPENRPTFEALERMLRSMCVK